MLYISLSIAVSHGAVGCNMDDMDKHIGQQIHGIHKISIVYFIVGIICGYIWIPDGVAINSDQVLSKSSRSATIW